MEKSVDYIRRLTLATTKIDGAYYFLSKATGINENTMVVLYALDDGKPHSQKQISHDWLIPKTTINTIVKDLAKAGYIMLVPEERSREKSIVITDSGKVYTEKIMKKVYEAENEAMEKTLEKFSPEFIDAIEAFAEELSSEFKKQLFKRKY